MLTKCVNITFLLLDLGVVATLDGCPVKDGKTGHL